MPVIHGDCQHANVATLPAAVGRGGGFGIFLRTHATEGVCVDDIKLNAIRLLQLLELVVNGLLIIRGEDADAVDELAVEPTCIHRLGQYLRVLRDRRGFGGSACTGRTQAERRGPAGGSRCRSNTGCSAETAAGARTEQAASKSDGFTGMCSVVGVART